MFDNVPVYQMIEDLTQVKLSSKKREDLKRATALFRATGSLPVGIVNELRKLHRDKRRSIESVYEAREKARISIARRRMGLSEDTINSIRDDRMSSLESRHNDLGI